MSKVIKVVMGIILMGISLFFLLGSILVIKDAKEDAVYSLHSYIQVEQTGCEYLGQNPVINGREKQADEGYGFYKITFEAENLSSVPYYGSLADILDIDRGMDDEDVGLMILPSTDSSPGYFETTTPAFPGKAAIDFAYYLEIKESVESVQASYWPTWDEDQVQMNIVLD